MALDNFHPTRQGLPNYEGKLLIALGSIFLLLIIIVTATGSWLILNNTKEERMRLGATVTHVISNSINNVSFSGKYHTRLLVENLVETNPEIAYIIVEDSEGRIFAHSNPTMNDKLANDLGAPIAHKVIGGALHATQELEIEGRSVTEFDEPFAGGYGNQLLGVVRVGISRKSAIDAQKKSFLYIIILVVFLIIVSLVAILHISRFFSAPVNNMALTLKGIMANAPMAICIQNRDQIITEANDRFILTFGMAPRFLGKASIVEALPETFSEDFTKSDKDIYESGKPYQNEQTLTTHEGVQTFMINRFPVAVDRSGKVEEICTFFLDVTETQQLEEQLRHAQKMEAVGHLAGGISHDFNNLMTGIIGYADLTKLLVNEDSEIMTNMNDLLFAANRATDLTSSLLAFSSKQLLNPRTIDIHSLVQKMETLLLNVVGETVELHIKPKAIPPVFVIADESQIEQVLLNLLANAKDAMPDGGTVSVSFEETMVGPDNPEVGSILDAGSYGKLTVQDTGSGMSPTVLTNIFEPFYTTKPKGKGTGLGLSTAYGIIKQHHGQIVVQSTENVGTTFTIYLPTGAIISEVTLADGSESTNSIPCGMETILLAEDEQLVRHLIKSMLIGAGYKVITANDGQSAVEEFRKFGNTIDLILMDVVMPRLNGREAMDTIRTMAPNVHCIFMSGYTSEILSDDNILRGDFNFMAKPVRRDTLLKNIRSVIEQQT